MTTPVQLELSAVIVTDRDASTIEETIRSLAGQTVRERIQLLIVTSQPSVLGAPPAAARLLGDVQVVEAPPAASSGAMRAVGIRHATADVVAFCEDHVRLDSHWAHALIERHREPWAVVGPAFENANPFTLTSWADLVLAYGPWLVPVDPGAVGLLPGHNSSYKRARLLAYGERLDALLDAESALQWDLVAAGEQLYLEPRARLAHVNFVHTGVWLRAQFHAGRVFAATRAEHARWSRPRRIAYTLASPLIPVVRMVRCVRHARRGAGGRFPRVLVPVALGLVVDGAGQCLGYAAGARSSAAAMFPYELDRVGINAGLTPSP